MAEIRIVFGGEHDFTNQTLTDIDRIEFDTFARTLAIFSSSQFGPDLISNNVVVADEGFALNDIRVEMSASGSFSAAGWTFEN